MNAWIRIIGRMGLRFKYKYDESGNRIEEEIEQVNGRMLIKIPHIPLSIHPIHLPNPKINIKYTYNDKTQLIKEEGYIESRRGIKKLYTTEYTYDLNGNQIEVSTTISLRRQRKYTTTYEYDSNNLLRKITYPNGTEEEYINSTCGDKRIGKIKATRETRYYLIPTRG